MRGNNTHKFHTISIQPHWMQYFINEFIPLVLCLAIWLSAGLDNNPFSKLLLCIAGALSLFLVYKFIYLQLLIYSVTGEQLVIKHGVFTRNSDYIELYRIVDYDERRNFIQQILGLKTVSVYSGDRTNPRLDIIGVLEGNDMVGIIRERVEYNKLRKGVYEITNR